MEVGILRDLGRPPWDKPRQACLKDDTISETFAKGDVFSFSRRSSMRELSGNELARVFSYCDHAVLMRCTEVCMKWFTVGMPCMCYTTQNTQICSTARIGFLLKPKTKRKVRGLDCLDPNALCDVTYTPFTFRLCPTYGMFANRRLVFAFLYDVLVLQTVVLHPYGKIIAGKTYFYLTSVTQHKDILSHLAALMHLTPGACSTDTSLYNPSFKVANQGPTRRREMFESQRGITPSSLQATPQHWGDYITCHEVFTMETIEVRAPAKTSVGEVRSVLHERLRLDVTRSVVVLSKDYHISNDWDPLPATLVYVVIGTGINETCQIKLGISLTVVSPDVGVGTLRVLPCTSVGRMKKAVLDVLGYGNGTVMIQSKPGVIVDDGDQHLVVGYSPQLLYEDAGLVVYVATSFMTVKAVSGCCCATVVVAVNPEWTVHTFLFVLHAALRRLSHYPPNDTIWCSVEHRDREELPFPSRVSIFTSKVTLPTGRYLAHTEKLHAYWHLPEHNRYMTVECNTDSQ